MLVLGVMLLLAIWGTTVELTRSADRFVYDHLLTASPRGADDRIIVIAIDDRSLEALGRWPWSRSIHAQLLNRLASDRASQPKAVLLDLLLTEPSASAAEDASLASAMGGLPCVTVPMVREPVAQYGQTYRVHVPVAPLAAVARVGHAHLRPDSDGVARSVFLREGTEGTWFDHVAWALFSGCKSEKTSDSSMLGTSPANGTPAPTPLAWRQDHHILIPYVGPPGSYMTVPYINVLRGEVPASLFKDRYVLLGATAPGLQDRLPTPTSADQGAMPGVEIHANVLDALLNDRRIKPLPLAPLLLATLLPLALQMLGFLFLKPRHSLALTASLWLLVITSSALAMQLAGIWWPPVTSLMVLTLTYLLWTWRRLEAVMAYMGRELATLDAEPAVLPELAPALPASAPLTDPLEQQIETLHRAVSRVRNLRQFASDSLEHLPVGAVVCDTAGRILSANRVACTLLTPAPPAQQEATDTVSLAGRNFSDVLRPWLLQQPDGTTEMAQLESDYARLSGLQVQGAQGRSFRLDLVPVQSTSPAAPMGWLIGLVDLTAEQNMQEQRADMLRFLSHDLRTPQSSILALLEMQEKATSAIPEAQLRERVARQVDRTLQLTDDFVQLARAESDDNYRFEIIDLTSVLLEACDQVWALARSRQIALQHQLLEDTGEGPVLVHADGALLVRAMVNLLGNALHYSPAHTTVTVGLTSGGGEAIVTIQDQGQGIRQQDIPHLFEKYRRFQPPTDGSAEDPMKVSQPANVQGLGLGLAQVKAVIERHKGHISCSSTPGMGTTFRITLPLCKTIDG